MQRASKASRKRTRAYISDAGGISGSTPAEISRKAPEGALNNAGGIALYVSGETLTATPEGGHSVIIKLATTSPKYGGVRWWYVCLQCEKRKTALYISGLILGCRQCAGLHYSGQSK